MGEDQNTPKPFRFESMWTSDPSNFVVVKSAWSKQFVGTLAFCLSQKIIESKSSLKKWNRDVFGNIHFKIKTLTDQIDTMQDLPPSASNFSSKNSILCELNECMIREDMHWRKKSRNQWLTSTNLNTRFFHLATIIRRRKIAIDFIKDENGTWLSGRHLVSDCFINYYKNLFTSQHTHPSHHIDLSDIIPHSISSKENEALYAIPSDDEIKSVAFSFASSKSPGPDGMSAIFSQILLGYYWQRSHSHGSIFFCQWSHVKRNEPHLHHSHPQDP